jgi:hypothetical protein
MKLSISLILIFFSQLEASPIYITFNISENEAHWAREEIESLYHIPSSMITIEKINEPCQKVIKNNLWQICIDDKGELYEVSSHQFFMKNTLKSFKKAER